MTRRGRLPKVTPNVVDRVVSFFDPVRGAQRHRARVMLALSGGGYLGARRDRRATQEWRPTSGSADSDLLPDLPDLRDRSRDQERNSPIGAGIVNTGVTNIVGTGLVPQSLIDRELLKLDDAAADAWQRQAEREFWLFAGTAECDITRTQNFCAMQDPILRGVFGSGDIFVVRRYLERVGSPYGLKLQMVEADRCSNPRMQRDGIALDNGNRLSGGVEADKDGAPIAYHFSKIHPGERMFAGPRDWDRILAYGEESNERQVLHLFRRLRPDQSRGVPLLAPVIEPLKQLTRLSESELMASVISSFFTAFIETETGEGVDLSATSGETGARSTDEDRKLGPGLILEGMPGEKFTSVNPARPNATFEPFFLAICREIGSAIGIPAELILKVFNSSYSASRASLLEAWKLFRVWRDWLAWDFCQPVYEWVLTEAVARGRLSAPGFFDDPLIRQAWLGSEWTGPPPGQVDPESEANAAEKWINLGVKTHQEVTAEITGGDWETKHVQLAKERKMRERDGLDSEDVGQRFQAPAPQGGGGNEPAPAKAPPRESPTRRERQAAMET